MRPLSVVAVGLAVLAAVVPVSSAPAGQLSILVGTGGYEDAAKPFFEQFEKQTGIKVTLNLVPYQDRFNKIVTAGASNVPTYDVVRVDVIWVPQFVQAGWLEDLTGKFPDRLLRQITKSTLDAVTVNGRLYGIPAFNSAKYFYYNEKMLRDAGYTRPPRTLDEFRAYARKLTRGAGADKVWGTVMSWVKDEALMVDWVIFTFAYPNARLFDEAGNPVFNTGAGVQALEYMVRLLREDKVVDPVSLTIHEDEVNKAFLAGKAAMILNWEGTEPASRDPKQSRVVGQVRVGLIPAQPPVVSSTVLGPEYYSILKTSRNKDAALKWIEFMTTEDVQRTIFTRGGFFPIYDRLYRDPQLAKELRDFDKYGEQLKYAHNRPAVPRYTEVADAIITELHQALLGRKTAKRALDDAAAAVRRILGK
jgi:multiple sugar transport system substrate-binding protein